jgi:hypothetical protein
MKKLYTCITLLLAVIAFSFNTTYAGTQGIFITSVENDTVCADGYIDVVYYCSGFTPTGTLSVELSDATGSFANPVVIRTVAAAPSGTIYANIPSNTTAGNGYRVRITSSAPAFTGAPNAVDIRVNPKPQPVITTLGGDTAYCQGGCAPLLVNDDPSFVAYSWFQNGIQFSNSSMIQNNSCINGDCFAASVIDTNGCEGVSNTLCITVYQNPEPIISADGPLTFCEDQCPNLFLDDYSALTGQTWFINGNENTNVTICGTCLASNGDCFFAVARDTNGCEGISNTLCITLYPIPVIEITTNDPLEFCDEDDITFNATPGYEYYDWLIGGGSMGLPGLQSFTSDLPYNDCYSVEVTDTNGCTGISNEICVTVHPTPEPVITADGPPEFCEGECITLSLDQPYACTLWNSGSNTATIPVCYTGEYSVMVCDNNGCTGSSDEILIIVNLLPNSNILGPNGFCEGECIELVGIDDPFNPLDFLWSDGSTDMSMEVCDSGIYTLTVTDNMTGCSSTSSDTITTHPLPEPVILANWDTLICSPAFSNYQWYADGNPISGAVFQIYNATTCADYTVTVTDANGCTATSDTLFCSIGMNELTNNNYFTLYPNPATSTLTIQTDNPSPITDCHLQIHNAQGQFVFHSSFDVHHSTFDISSFSNGIYFLTLSNGEQTLSRKFVKQ